MADTEPKLQDQVMAGEDDNNDEVHSKVKDLDREPIVDSRFRKRFRP